jgi:CheY-like chemotaxis protein
VAIVLLTEEGPADRALGRKTLLAAGHTIVEAANGAEALWALAREPIEVIVLDSALPDMTGETLIDRIREIPAHVLTPIVATVAVEQPPGPKRKWWAMRPEDPAERSPLAEFAVEKLPKPFAPHQLVEAVARATLMRAELGASVGDPQQRALGFAELARLQNQARDEET